MEATVSARAVDSILECIGNTPIVRLHRVADHVRTPIYGKCEFMNPGASVKDRIGIAIIEDAERSGRLRPGGLIVEGTSGNTGIGLALAAAIKGYRCIFTIPDKMSIEKIKLLKAYGAEVIVTPTVEPEHPEYYVTVAKRICAENDNAILANQFHNEANPEAHYRTTGPELWQQTEGRITHLVGSMGTGGTMSGTARYLKEKNPNIRVIGADPVGSVFKAFKETGVLGRRDSYKVEGIGNDCIPDTLDISLIDEIRNISDKDAFLMTRRLAREEGLFVGGSTGLNVVAALQVAGEIDDPNACIVVILCDTGERYLSKVHSDEWMQENRFLLPVEGRARDLIRDRSEMESLVAMAPTDTVGACLGVMNRHGFTQIPIIEGEQCIGAVTESTLMQLAFEDRDVLEHPVSRHMEAPFPTVASDMALTHVSGLFSRRNDAVLVKTGNKLTGIITRFDMLQHLSGR